MKNPVVVLTILLITAFTACKGAHNKTSGDSRDSSASHGNSGAAADTINGSAAPFAESTSGSDTSTDGHSVDDPLADTVHSKKH
jgi:hypothetical protein